MKKTYNIVRIVIAAMIIILEILPFGTTFYYTAPPESGEIVTSVHVEYSYFSLTPMEFGFAAPFITALTSCLLLMIAIITLFSKRSVWGTIACILSIATMVLSLCPLAHSRSNYSLISFVITALLASEIIISIMNLHVGVNLKNANDTPSKQLSV